MELDVEGRCGAGYDEKDGAIASLDQPLMDWFKEYPELDTLARKRITRANALSMTAGFDWNEDLSLTDPRNDQVRMFLEPRPLHYALSRPIVAKPGSVFRYNGGLTQAMAAVVQRAAKTPLQDYARAKLFEPLGIVDVEWMGSLVDLPPVWLRLHLVTWPSSARFTCTAGSGTASRWFPPTG